LYGFRSAYIYYELVINIKSTVLTGLSTGYGALQNYRSIVYGMGLWN